MLQQTQKRKLQLKLFPAVLFTACILALSFNTGCDNVDSPLDFSKVDTNKDGKISQSEFQKTNRPLSEFAQLDKDGDKSLSKKEFNFLNLKF